MTRYSINVDNAPGDDTHSAAPSDSRVLSFILCWPPLISHDAAIRDAATSNRRPLSLLRRTVRCWSVASLLGNTVTVNYVAVAVRILLIQF